LPALGTEGRMMQEDNNCWYQRRIKKIHILT